MAEISTVELRDRLAHWIWHVGQTRESLTITTHGRPVAVLGPPPIEKPEPTKTLS